MRKPTLTLSFPPSWLPTQMCCTSVGCSTSQPCSSSRLVKRASKAFSLVMMVLTPATLLRSRAGAVGRWVVPITPRSPAPLQFIKGTAKFIADFKNEIHHDPQPFCCSRVRCDGHLPEKPLKLLQRRMATRLRLVRL